MNLIEFEDFQSSTTVNTNNEDEFNLFCGNDSPSSVPQESQNYPQQQKQSNLLDDTLYSHSSPSLPGTYKVRSPMEFSAFDSSNPINNDITNDITNDSTFYSSSPQKNISLLSSSLSNINLNSPPSVHKNEIQHDHTCENQQNYPHDLETHNKNKKDGDVITKDRRHERNSGNERDKVRDRDKGSERDRRKERDKGRRDKGWDTNCNNNRNNDNNNNNNNNNNRDNDSTSAPTEGTLVRRDSQVKRELNSQFDEYRRGDKRNPSSSVRKSPSSSSKGNNHHHRTGPRSTKFDESSDDDDQMYAYHIDHGREEDMNYKRSSNHNNNSDSNSYGSNSTKSFEMKPFKIELKHALNKPEKKKSNVSVDREALEQFSRRDSQNNRLSLTLDSHPGYYGSEVSMDRQRQRKQALELGKSNSYNTFGGNNNNKKNNVSGSTYAGYGTRLLGNSPGNLINNNGSSQNHYQGENKKPIVIESEYPLVPAWIKKKEIAVDETWDHNLPNHVGKPPDKDDSFTRRMREEGGLEIEIGDKKKVISYNQLPQPMALSEILKKSVIYDPDDPGDSKNTTNTAAVNKNLNQSRSLNDISDHTKHNYHNNSSPSDHNYNNNNYNNNFNNNDNSSNSNDFSFDDLDSSKRHSGLDNDNDSRLGYTSLDDFENFGESKFSSNNSIDLKQQRSSSPYSSRKDTQRISRSRTDSESRHESRREREQSKNTVGDSEFYRSSSSGRSGYDHSRGGSSDGVNEYKSNSKQHCESDDDTRFRNTNRQSRTSESDASTSKHRTSGSSSERKSSKKRRDEYDHRRDENYRNFRAR